MRFLTLFVALTLFIHGSLSAQKSEVDSLQRILSKVSGDSQKAVILNAISLTLRTSDYSRSMEFAVRAGAIAEKAGVRTELAKSLVYQSVEHYYLGNYPKALESVLKALRIYEALDDKLGQASALNELGTFNKKQRKITLALDNFQKAIDLSKAAGDSLTMANCMNNIGVVYEELNEDDKAMDFYLRSARIKEAMKDLAGVAYNYDNIGINFTKRQRYTEAKSYLLKVIDIRKQLGDLTGVAISVNNLGEMYLAQGNAAEARKYFSDALRQSAAIHYTDLRRHIYNMISETYQKENNYKKAYEYVMKSTALKDSIFTERQSKQFLDLQTSYETEKKEKEILYLKDENELKDIRIHQNTIYIVGLVLLVPGLLLTGYLWQNRIKLKQQAELQLTRATLRESQLQAVISSQEKERKRFAADLHDGLGQMISALRLSLSKENPEKNIVDQALNLLNEMNVEIRNIAFNLMPQILMSGGLEDALNEFAGRVNRLGVTTIKVSSFERTYDMPSDQKIALYRVCQEWVNNSMKYSACRNIGIELVQHPDELVIIIEDDGHGFDKDVLMKGEGNGWKNISSRLTMMKGSIEINSRPGHSGTTVVISSPRFIVEVA